MYEALLAIFIIYGLLLFAPVRAKYYLGSFAVVLSLLAYGYDPIRAYFEYGIYTDLFRIFNDIDMFRLQGDDYVAYMSAPLSRVYVSFFALFTQNSLISACSALIFYGVSFAILLRIGRDSEATNKAIAAAGYLLVLITNYSVVIGNIRYTIATAIFVGLLYFDLYHHSVKAKLFYLLLPLFHPGSVLYLLMRLVTRKRMVFVFAGCAILAAVMYTNIDAIFAYLIGFADVYFQDMQSKMEAYSDVTNYAEPVASLYYWFFLQVAFLIYLLYDATRIADAAWRESTHLFRNFIWLMIFLSVGSVMNYQFMIRLFQPSILFIPIAFLFDVTNRIHSGKRVISRYVLMALVVLIAFVYYFGQTFGYHSLTF